MRRYRLHLAAISALAAVGGSATAQEGATTPASGPAAAQEAASAPATPPAAQEAASAPATPPAAQEPATAPAPAATPAPTPPTAEERERLLAASRRGLQIFEIARAGMLTTQDMLSRIPDPAAAGIVGWVATPEGEGLGVVYYADGPEGPVAVYRGQVVGGRLISRDVYSGSERPALTATHRRMAAARAAAAAVERQPCAGAFNVIVIPPASAESAIEVYKLSPQTQRGRVPAGGHFLATVAPDGTVSSTTDLAGRCTDLVTGEAIPAAGTSGPARPLTINHMLGPLPTEIHVFLSLMTNRPLIVGTAEPSRQWSIARGRIGLVGAVRVPPPGPGR
jgi:hypothetical protein